MRPWISDTKVPWVSETCLMSRFNRAAQGSNRLGRGLNIWSSWSNRLGLLGDCCDEDVSMFELVDLKFRRRSCLYQPQHASLICCSALWHCRPSWPLSNLEQLGEALFGCPKREGPCNPIAHVGTIQVGCLRLQLLVGDGSISLMNSDSKSVPCSNKASPVIQRLSMHQCSRLVALPHPNNTKTVVMRPAVIIAGFEIRWPMA